MSILASVGQAEEAGLFRISVSNIHQGTITGDWWQSQGNAKSKYYWRMCKVREALLKVTDSGTTFIEFNN